MHFNYHKARWISFRRVSLLSLYCCNVLLIYYLEESTAGFETIYFSDVQLCFMTSLCAPSGHSGVICTVN